METQNDFVLIEKALLGEKEAFAKLYERYYSFLFKYLLKITTNEEISKDLTQETMLKAYLKLNTFQGESQFSTWLISIASRLYMDFLRKRKKEARKLSNLKSDLSRKIIWLADKQNISWSDTFLSFNELDPKLKVPILLKHYYGYSYEEIAVMLGMREGTVKSRVHNGLKKLKETTFEMGES
ncbi:putative RNA polymerase [Bacillus sp. TS-2]|nr:putative RNA polymerase [Bacillus sp. TS-2]